MSQLLHRGYDQSALDAQYNARAAVPEFGEFAERWSASSQTVALTHDCFLDLPYGDSSGETLDVVKPARRGAPIHIFFHGGYWRSMDKAVFRFLAPPFVERGALYVIPNYDLCPKVDMDEIVRQCRASIAWVWHNAERLGGDRNRLYISGHSAGGHIVAMALATDWSRFSVPADLLRGVTALSGLHDLETIRRTFLNADLRMSPEQAARLSPVLNVPARATPLIVAVGAAESDEFRRQSADYVAAWRTRGHLCEHLEVAGRHHYSVLDALAEPGKPLCDAVLRQMRIG